MDKNLFALLNIIKKAYENQLIIETYAPFSRMNKEICLFLKKMGIIFDFKVVKGRQGFNKIHIVLISSVNLSVPFLEKINKIKDKITKTASRTMYLPANCEFSVKPYNQFIICFKPGKQINGVSVKTLKKISKFGVSVIISTSKGLMLGSEAAQLGMGGIIVCKIGS